MNAHEQFTRDQVQRLADVSQAQLAYWERLGILGARRRGSRRIYDFRDLISLRTTKQLIDEGVPAHKLRRALLALEEKLSDVKAPLTELRIVSNGKDLVVDYAGSRLEPLTGQLVLNFETRELDEKIRVLPPSSAAQPALSGEAPSATQRPQVTVISGGAAARTQQQAASSAADWMARAAESERRGIREEAIGAYQQAVAREPRHVDAWINLGTLHYDRGEFPRAYECFRRASEIDAASALAMYNVGCVLEDLGQVHSAREYLREAVRLDPAFADAHYNLALLCERLDAAGEALPHWRRYLELDPNSPWCDYARQRIRPHVVPRAKEPSP